MGSYYQILYYKGKICMKNSVKQTLMTKLSYRTARVAVLGLGYVGLPLVVAFGEAGFVVTGIDPDKNKVDTVNRRESHIQDISSEQVACLVDAGKLKATTDFSA